MIHLEGISKSFGGVQALAPTDLEVRPGERLALLGRNGSGKTTLLRMLVGLSKPSGGRLLLGGERLRPGGWRAFRGRLGFMPERVVFHENLTGATTLGFYARLRGVEVTEVRPMLDRVGLRDAADKKVGVYSKGMRQRLNLAQALLGDPRVLVLDEPLEGLDSHGVRRFFELVDRVEGRTVVFSSHRLSEVSGTADRICILKKGVVQALGTESELRGELDLPLKVILRSAPDLDQELQAALGRLSTAIVAGRNGSIVISVPQGNKIPFLAELNTFSEAIEELRFEEPTLEEVLAETD
ncbi:MAG: ABC transporter ATP-binding protein [bacterium]|nr:ABC transporter ATP-binding protein [bacterium]